LSHDIRFFIKNGFYADTAFSKLFNKGSPEKIFLEKDITKKLKLHPVDKSKPLITNIIERSKERGILINKDVLEYAKFNDDFNSKLTAKELATIEKINIINKLSFFDVSTRIETDHIKKTYFLKELSKITPKSPLEKEIVDNYESAIKDAENILSKLL